MANRPRIGVTGNNKSFSPSWIFLSLAVRLAGGIPTRIHIEQRIEFRHLQAVIVSGGDDIHPTLYESDPARESVYDRQRDALELEHIRYAQKHCLPLLGICRGHQLINVACGGSLLQDIDLLRQHTSPGRSLLPSKQVRISSTTRLIQVLRKSEIKVNSLHDQAIDRVGIGLQSVAFDHDNFIQAIESSNAQPLIGVQWHPEYLFFLPTQFRIFRWLVEEAQTQPERCHN
ncbi:MAG: gamma-glutamyl-gamma-aminobutyrate hydrolase family protein [Desulfobacterales bacterium]|nr:gamma-glutamyl-gamma-aminobutyrate hydrolase family protein [Deltaproteobacteria bacterium]NNK94718.1 gamma-glutamyl-gamma-aminobutyrate hydrolase family protein [Desulfobacterales bacterium]